MCGDTLTIFSRDRVPFEGKSDDFVINLPRAFQATRIKLIHAMIPNAAYTITLDNNLLHMALQVVATSVITNYDVDIPAGYYTPNTLASQLTASISAATGVAVAVTYIEVAGRFSFVPAATHLISIRGSVATKAAYRPLGLAAVDTAFAAIYVSANVIDLSTPLMVTLNIDGTGVNAYTSNQYGVDATFIVPMLANAREVAVYTENNDFDQSAEIRDVITRLRVKLRKLDGSDFDMNGIDWCFTIRLQ